jgi:uncharacterized protein (DUF2147 family)
MPTLSIRTRLMTAAIALLASSALPEAPAAAQRAGNPVGSWLTEGGHGVIRIAPCDEGLCGTIVGIDRAPGEKMPTDVAGRPQCGLRILTSSADIQSGISTGHITDPRDGKTYNAQLWVDGSGRLHMRGYLGVPLLGKTQVWQPFTGHLAADCRFVS